MNQQTPSIKAEAGRLNRLYRERDRYLEQAADYKSQAVALRNAGGPPAAYDELMSKYQDCVAWSYGLTEQIETVGKDLERAINAAGWGFVKGCPLLITHRTRKTLILPR